MGFEQEEAQRRGLLTMLQNKQEVVSEYGAEVDKGGAGMVFGVGSFVMPDAPWSFEALGGRELSGFLTVKGGCSRKCCGKLAGGRLNGRAIGITPAWDGVAWPPGDVWDRSVFPESGLHVYVVRVSCGLGRQGAGGRTFL